MPINQNEDSMRVAFAPLRTLEPSEADVARVIARLQAQPKRPAVFRAPGDWQRIAAPGLAALALLAGGLYSVPATRAAIDDVTGSLASVYSGWMGGDSTDAPGRPLGANEQAPTFFYDDVKQPRVVAEADGNKLYAYLGPDGRINLEAIGKDGGAVGMPDMTADQFKDRTLFVFHNTIPFGQVDENGHTYLFGVTARAVTRVELSYASGPPLRVDGVDGGFVMPVEPDRKPQEVRALDADGNVIGSEELNGPLSNWQHYSQNR